MSQSMIKLIVSVLFLLHLFSGVKTQSAQKVIYYLGSWSLDRISPKDIRFADMTHLMYAFVTPLENGNLDTSTISAKLPEVVSLAHAKGVKVLVSIGGAASSANFAKFGNNAAAQAVFAKSLLDLVTKYQLDGADIDWEFPDTSTSAGYSGVMKAVWDLFDPKGLLVSSAVAASVDYGTYFPASAFNYMHFVNVMAYDFSGSWTPAGPHASYEQILGSLSYWITQRGISANKIVLGIPFYGKDFNNNAASVLYSKIIDDFKPTPDLNMINNIYFDGIDLVKRKCQLAQQMKLGGVMAWEYLMDSTAPQASLISAISTVMNPSTVPSAPTPAPGSAPTPAPAPGSAPTPAPTPKSAAISTLSHSVLVVMIVVISVMAVL